MKVSGRDHDNGLLRSQFNTFEMVVSFILGEDWLRKPSIVTTLKGFSLIRSRAFKLYRNSVGSSSIFHRMLTRP